MEGWGQGLLNPRLPLMWDLGSCQARWPLNGSLKPGRACLSFAPKPSSSLLVFLVSLGKLVTHGRLPLSFSPGRRSASDFAHRADSKSFSNQYMSRANDTLFYMRISSIQSWNKHSSAIPTYKIVITLFFPKFPLKESTLVGKRTTHVTSLSDAERLPGGPRGAL